MEFAIDSPHIVSLLKYDYEFPSETASNAYIGRISVKKHKSVHQRKQICCENVWHPFMIDVPSLSPAPDFFFWP